MLERVIREKINLHVIEEFRRYKDSGLEWTGNPDHRDLYTVWKYYVDACGEEASNVLQNDSNVINVAVDLDNLRNDDILTNSDSVTIDVDANGELVLLIPPKANQANPTVLQAYLQPSLDTTIQLETPSTSEVAVTPTTPKQKNSTTLP